MQNNEQNSQLNDDTESRRLRHDADSGNDASSTEMLKKEGLIDPGNEHHHTGDNDMARSSSRHDADAGGDATGTTGPKPGEGKNDEADTSGEAG